VNRLQLVQRLKRESARSGPPPASIAVLSGDDILLDGWLGDAWLEVQRRRMDWHWMRKTVTGPLTIDVGVYAASDLDPLVLNFGRWQDDTGDYTVRAYNTAAPGVPINLTWVPYEVFQARFLVSTVTNAAPVCWSIAPDKRLLIGPKPNTGDYTVTADYWAKPTALVADADEPDMPEQFHMLLVWRALLEVAGFDAAPEVESRAKRNLRMAWADLLDDQAPRVRLSDEPLC
jgi:hypothetical protein